MVREADGAFPGGVSPDLFEFFSHERVINHGNSGMILFRERSARQLPDGTWQRDYCLSDGKTFIMPSDDFTEFERVRKDTDANAPAP